MAEEGKQQKNNAGEQQGKKRGNETKVEWSTNKEGKWIQLGVINCCSLQGFWGSVGLINGAVYDT